MSDSTPQQNILEPIIVENTDINFDDDDQLGVEFIKVYIKDTNDGTGFGVNLIHKPGIEEKLPQEFINYCMNNIGKFMLDATKQLYNSSVAAAQEEEQNKRNAELEHAIKKARKGER